jgi:hypothetical protein
MSAHTRTLGLAIALTLAAITNSTLAQQRFFNPSDPSNYPVGPIGGVQVYNPNWRSYGAPPSTWARTPYPTYVDPAFGYNSGFGYRPASGYGVNHGLGYGVTTVPFGYAVPGYAGTGYVQLPSYGFTSGANVTGFGVSTYGSYSSQYGALGFPLSRSYGYVRGYRGFGQIP